MYRAQSGSMGAACPGRGASVECVLYAMVGIRHGGRWWLQATGERWWWVSMEDVGWQKRRKGAVCLE